MKEFDDYQEKASAFASAGAGQYAMACYALGLAGETGEVVEHFKKFVHYKRPLDKEAVVLELGDVLWYLSALATLVGVSLADIASQNIDKLELRNKDE